MALWTDSRCLEESRDYNYMPTIIYVINYFNCFNKLLIRLSFIQSSNQYTITTQLLFEKVWSLI